METGTAAGSHNGGSTEHPSLALDLILQQFEEGVKYRVLDLGRANSENIRFFAGHACILQIVDLQQTLFPDSPLPPMQPRQFERLLTRELPSEPAEPADVILAWDLFNYLSGDEISVVAGQLTRFCRPGTVLFALIATHAQMSSRPLRYRISTPKIVAYDAATDQQRSSPRYKEPDLERYLAPFQVETSFLLRNGMQEYVLVYETPAAAGAGHDGAPIR